MFWKTKPHYMQTLAVPKAKVHFLTSTDPKRHVECSAALPQNAYEKHMEEQHYFQHAHFFSQHWINRLTWPAQWFNTMSIAESRPAFSRLSWEAWRKTGGFHTSTMEISPKWPTHLPQSPAVSPKPLTLPPRNH